MPSPNHGTLRLHSDDEEEVSDCPQIVFIVSLQVEPVGHFFSPSFLNLLDGALCSALKGDIDK